MDLIRSPRHTQVTHPTCSNSSYSLTVNSAPASPNISLSTDILFDHCSNRGIGRATRVPRIGQTTTRLNNSRSSYRHSAIIHSSNRFSFSGQGSTSFVPVFNLAGSVSPWTVPDPTALHQRGGFFDGLSRTRETVDERIPGRHQYRLHSRCGSCRV